MLLPHRPLALYLPLNASALFNWLQDAYDAANGNGSGYTAPLPAGGEGLGAGMGGATRFAPSSAAAGSSGSGSQEARAVDKVCTPAGLRAAPDREDLRVFVEAVSALDGQQVAQLLQERLVSNGFSVGQDRCAGFLVDSLKAQAGGYSQAPNRASSLMCARVVAPSKGRQLLLLSLAAVSSRQWLGRPLLAAWMLAMGVPLAPRNTAWAAARTERPCMDAGLAGQEWRLCELVTYLSE